MFVKRETLLSVECFSHVIKDSTNRNKKTSKGIDMSYKQLLSSARMMRWSSGHAVRLKIARPMMLCGWQMVAVFCFDF